jgi:integrase
VERQWAGEAGRSCHLGAGVDYDAEAATITVTGKVVRVSGQGLVRVDETKSAAGCRTSPSKKSSSRQRRGTLRDPDNFNRQWRQVRDGLGAADVSSHSFRKTVATLIDDEGLSARIGADHLGHAHVSMTQDVYMTRGRVHAQVAELLDRTVAVRDESISGE